MQAASLSKIWRFDRNVGPENLDSSSLQGDVFSEFPNQKLLNVSERRELIHALSKQPEEAYELLNSWSRNEIMTIICAEMGKERKYTGLNKPKLIENLLNLVSRPLGETSCSDPRNTRRKPKKTTSYVICCENFACRAALGTEDGFCRRCSCCICHNFDDNKDPSLWLTCEACGLSCHLECGLKEDKYRIGCDNDDESGLDGMFYCAFCGKENDLLGGWRKQVKVANETRRVDVLCYRVSLGQKLLRGTKKYRNLLELMDEAVKKLEGDVGPLSGWAMKMARGIVNRLASGAQVQKLCSLAIEALDKIVAPSESDAIQGDKMSVRVEEIQARSVIVRLDSEEASSSLPTGITGFRLFCQKSKDEECSFEVNSVVYLPETSSTIQGLEPETEFCLRVVSFNEECDLDESELRFSTLKDDINEADNRQSALTNSCIGLCSNPSLPEDESNNVHKSCSKENGDTDNIDEHCSAEEVESEIEYERVVKRKVISELLVTPCKEDTSKDKQGETKRSKSRKATVNKKPNQENGDTNNIDEHCSAGEVESEIEYERVVKRRVISELLVTPCKEDTSKDKQGETKRSKSRKATVNKKPNQENGDTNNIEHCSAGEVESEIGNERVVKRKVISDLLGTPCKGDTSKDKQRENQRSKSRKTTESNKPETDVTNGVDKDLGRIVKTIRRLEQEGHIDRSFRERFLTWYCLRATQREVRVVKLFVETFMEDLSSLGEQLVDTFSECILSKRSSTTGVGPAGICLKLWH